MYFGHNVIITHYTSICFWVKREPYPKVLLGLCFTSKFAVSPLVWFICQQMTYVNLVEIGSVVFKIREVEIGKILIRVNNTLVFCATFLAARHTTVCLNGCGLSNTARHEHLPKKTAKVTRY